MKRILSILYLILYLSLIVVSTSDNLAQGYPLWVTTLGIVCPFAAAVSILLYIVRCRPNALTFLWKLIPIALIAFDMFSWYYDLIVSGEPDDTSLLIGVTTVLGIIILFPSWFMTVRFGYLKEIEKKADNKPWDATGDNVLL